MKYIKARYKLTRPSTDAFEVYGWQTEWTKKTQMIAGEPVEVGSIVDFQPITVHPDGKFLFPATKSNVARARAMIGKNQLALAPGENLDTALEVEAKVVEDKWPEPPQAATAIDMMAMEAAGSAAERPDLPVQKARRSRKPADIEPDVEA